MERKGMAAMFMIVMAVCLFMAGCGSKTAETAAPAGEASAYEEAGAYNAGDDTIVLEGVSGDRTKEICQALFDLEAGGSTYGSKGIETAYRPGGDGQRV